MRQTCKRPDRDVPGIVCGYPLPCPHHTATIDLNTGRVRVPPGQEAARPRLEQIAEALGAKPARKRSKR